ncbi:hypothetical protein BMF94_1010 [Rhodotorula taiwanensis]|uniref:Uncharacterized protein n=1 Tax=Rhodotorula taiwanensis TaxID=741276 RepID=A0A2S5BGM8_9BASI|nr:hypothetical protein BMF94_1010 [Rhodotorula taiwanensis]
MDSLTTRLNHPHYYACALLSLPLPVWLAVRLAASSTLTTALLAAPVLLALSVVARRPLDNLETFAETTTFQLRLLNLFGFIFTRNQLGTGWRTVFLYFGAWMLVSFFLPQPPYLGKSKLVLMTSDEFDTNVLLLPPAPTVALGAASDPKIVELKDDDQSYGSEAVSAGKRDKYHLVLFHADFSKKSRQLQLTLSRLSNLYSSPRLDFVLLDPDAAPTTFYDLGLATGPTSLDLPLLRMYRRGKAIQQVPLSETEARRSIRRKKREGRQADKRRDGIVASESESGGGSSDEDGASDESEDERQVAQERAMSRYKWDTSGSAIERAFKLQERSGLAPKGQLET